jgi:hypothetical protein
MNEDIYKAACIIARRFTNMISGILRDEEKGDAEREGYRIAKEVLDELFKGVKR